MVVAGIDPKRLLTKLVDPVTLGPTMAWRAGNIRTAGDRGESEPGPGRPAPLPGGRRPRRAPAPRPDPARARHRRPGARLRCEQVRADERAPHARGDDPVARGPVPRCRRRARPAQGAGPRHERHRPVDAVHAARRRLGQPAATRSATSWSASSRRSRRASASRSSLARSSRRSTLSATTASPAGIRSTASSASTSSSCGGRSSATPVIGCRSDGLYLAGSGAHPGGGITGAPGANAAREILADGKRRR